MKDDDDRDGRRPLRRGFPRRAAQAAALALAGAAFELLAHVEDWVRSGLLGRVALGLVIGAIGGVLFYAAGAPLAFMLGSLFFTMAASLAGLPVASTQKLRMTFLFLVGLFLGQTFETGAADRFLAWPLTMALAIAYVPVAIWIAWSLYLRAARLDPKTALLAAVPGGLSGIIAYASTIGAREYEVTLTQSLRVALVVATAPALFFGVIADPSLAAGAHDADALFGRAPPLTLGEAVLLFSAALGVFWGLTRIGMPLPSLVAPLFASAVLRLSGLVEGELPAWLVELAFIVVGTSLGCRFRGAPVADLGRLALWTAVGTALMALVSALFAAPMAAIGDVSYSVALLALMPGGVAEMCIIALALDLDPSFVAAHHVARIVFILAAAPALPVLIRWAEQTGRRGAPAAQRSRRGG